LGASLLSGQVLSVGMCPRVGPGRKFQLNRPCLSAPRGALVGWQGQPSLGAAGDLRLCRLLRASFVTAWSVHKRLSPQSSSFPLETTGPEWFWCVGSLREPNACSGPPPGAVAIDRRKAFGCLDRRSAVTPIERFRKVLFSELSEDRLSERCSLRRLIVKERLSHREEASGLPSSFRALPC
jgi:hypothetical protein